MNDPSLLVLRVPCWLQKGTKRRKAGQHSQPCEERLAPHELCCSGKNVGPGVLRPGREASLGLSLLKCHGGLWYPSVHYLDLGMAYPGPLWVAAHSPVQDLQPHYTRSTLDSHAIVVTWHQRKHSGMGWGFQKEMLVTATISSGSDGSILQTGSSGPVGQVNKSLIFEGQKLDSGSLWPFCLGVWCLLWRITVA